MGKNKKYGIEKDAEDLRSSDINISIKLNEELKKWFESDEGKAEVERLNIKFENENKFIESCHSRLCNMSHDDFVRLIKKVEDKYSSDEYKDRWYDRGFCPECFLYSVMETILSRYGQETQCDSCFGDAYIYKGVKFEVFHGQGEVHINYKLL